jgi:hypothetical protein
MTTPQPNDEPPTSYPSSWRPREAPISDDEPLEPLAVEAYIGSLSQTELTLLLARARGDR